MSEFQSQPNPEEATNHERRLSSLIEQYFPEDTEFVAGLSLEEAIGFVYGQLLELHEDPDEILVEFGVIERGDDEV